jgi:hypothetical protein
MAYLRPVRVFFLAGKRACQETGGRAQAYGAVRREARVIWRKLDCLNPSSQKA